MEIKGFVQDKKIKEGVSKTGQDFKRTSISIDGKIFSSFNDLSVVVGDYVRIEFEQSGNYNNIKSIDKLETEDVGGLSEEVTQTELVSDVDAVEFVKKLCIVQEQKKGFATQTHHVTAFDQHGTSRTTWYGFVYYKQR